jgi:hypothetical protein
MTIFTNVLLNTACRGMCYSKLAQKTKGVTG